MDSYGKITRSELHPSLLELIETSGGSSVKFMKSSTTLSSSTNEVSINIDTFNKDKDLLLVYKNSVYLEETEDYTISPDNSKIISVDENFSTGTIFNFIVFANCQELTGGQIDGTKLLANSVGINKLETGLAQNINNLINGMDIDGGYFGEAQTGNIVDGGEF